MALEQDKLIRIVKQRNGACVDKGGAIQKLLDEKRSDGTKTTQRDVATLTGESTSQINHLFACFRYLKGRSVQMCKARAMNSDACYLLAKEKLTESEQDKIVHHAIEIGQERKQEETKNRKSKSAIMGEDMRVAILLWKPRPKLGTLRTH